MTHIQWTEKTWNPIVGCSIVSKGCTNCYAMKMAARLEAIGTAPHYRGTTQASKAGPVWTGQVYLAPDSILAKPLRWKKPAMIFVNSMSDLWHEAVPDEWIDQVFAIMALTPQHTYQVLTKRAELMKAYMSDQATHERVVALAERISDLPCNAAWRLKNVWLGVSVEDQATADERIPHLLETPAAIRWISAEPLLGAVNLKELRKYNPQREPWINALTGSVSRGGLPTSPNEGGLCTSTTIAELPRLDWVVVGGESGPGARPMHPDWARSLRDQCADAKAPFFFKQWGEWEVAIDRERDDPDWRADYSRTFANTVRTKWINLEGSAGFHGKRFHVMRRVGKKAAGDLLDGVQHHNWPAIGATT